METLLLIIGLASVALFVFRPAATPQIIYVPVEVHAAQRSGLGCLPVVVVVVMVLLVLGVMRF